MAQSTEVTSKEIFSTEENGHIGYSCANTRQYTHEVYLWSRARRCKSEQSLPSKRLFRIARFREPVLRKRCSDSEMQRVRGSSQASDPLELKYYKTFRSMRLDIGAYPNCILKASSPKSGVSREPHRDPSRAV